MTTTVVHRESTRSSALALAGLAFALAAPSSYLLQRIFERLRGGTFDPSLIVQEPTATFYWRFGIASWSGGVVAIAAFAYAHRTTFTDRARRLWTIALISLPLFWAFLTWRFP